MSRGNHERKEARKRERERGRWGCKNPAGCTFVFKQQQLLAGLAVEARVAAARRMTPSGPTTIVCPRCNTFHFLAEGRDAVRLLTPAEKFQLYVDAPSAAARAETHKTAPGVAELHMCRVEE